MRFLPLFLALALLGVPTTIGADAVLNIDGRKFAPETVRLKIRNGEWEYGLFTPDGKPIPVDTEKACMHCHKRYEATDYTFIVHNYFADLVKK